jgi:SAM-dependent methyltransferase
VELSVDFRSLGEWLAYREANASLFNQTRFQELGHQVLRVGCREPLTGAVIAGSELDAGSSWREGLAYEGVNSRVRGVMQVIASILDEQGCTDPRIYSAEAVTPFALRLRGRYSRFLGSEFTLDPKRREWMYPIPCEDLQGLSMGSDLFDIVSTNEVLEHVPSIDRALREMCRVLRPGGWHVGTVPFLYFEEKSVLRARLDKGKVIHLLEPEYHGDPMNDGGVLVFELPGWDIIDRAIAAGFSDASMRFVISTSHGILSEHIGGVFVFCCQK